MSTSVFGPVRTGNYWENQVANQPITASLAGTGGVADDFLSGISVKGNLPVIAGASGVEGPGLFGGLADTFGMKDGNVLGMDANQLQGMSTLAGLGMKAFALPGMLDYYNTKTDTAKFNLADAQKASANRDKFNQNTAEAFSLAAGK